HMHGELNGKRSTANSTTKAELLHYLVHNSDHRAIEYTSGIPFGTEPKNRLYYKKETYPTTVYFDKNEQRYWWNNGGDFAQWKQIKELDKLPATPAKVTMFLYIREWPLEPDLAVIENEQGNKALFAIRYLSGFGLPTLLTSDKAGFDYTEFIVYMSRFPQYRASYIVGRKTNGKWGIVAAKDQFAEEDDILIRITPKLDYEYDDPDSAINSMTSYKGYQTRVRHTAFYKKVIIK
ncbi:MAG: hypothetical protein IKB00_04770, partial [Bacteroidaceae bacterium]|nr:hypothetical protein [Bacteroidaceae bacterium]